jgi:hypothetical protein
MGAEALSADRFVRRTQLGRDEYRKNFRQLDREAIDAVTSREADAVTPLMSKVYLRLANAPEMHWEREGVLRFAGEERGGEWVTAWGQLVSLLGVASATARKALQWMHAEGVVGYYAGKNGVGIRVFLNRASSSIGRRAETSQKNLRLVHTSNGGARASAGDTPFSDSFAVSEVLETDLNPRAPKDGAEQKKVVKKYPDQHHTPAGPVGHDTIIAEEATPRTEPRLEIPVEDIVSRLRRELEPSLLSAARRAAAQEHERTREWLESRGLPKAARVAQREAYNVLRKCNLIRGVGENPSAATDTGRDVHAPAGPHRLSKQEVEEFAQACVAILEVKGRSVESTLSEMSVAAGGFLLPEDMPRVRMSAAALLREARSEEAIK